MGDTVRITLTISTMFSVRAHASKTVEVDREDWSEMTNGQREAVIREESDRFVGEQVDVGVAFEDPADDPADDPQG
jgi:hypothetical protein